MVSFVVNVVSERVMKKIKKMDNKGKKCSIPNCKSMARVKGLCHTHYMCLKYKEKRLKEGKDVKKYRKGNEEIREAPDGQTR